jgi:hypothetical protein
MEFVIGIYACLVALKQESEDLSRIERLRSEALKGKDAKGMIFEVERVRRITWRLGVLGASALSTLLLFMHVIPREKWVSCVVASWVLITSVLNFRAFHLEDEGTKVYKLL